MKRQLLLLTGFCLLALNISHAQNNLQQGDECFDKGEYECAKRSYSLYKTQNATAGMDEKIERCDECIKILGIANFLFSEKEYARAKDKYNELLALNPKDPHAKEQVTLCNSAISSVIRSNATQEDYLQKANDFFKKGDYANALQNYNLYKSLNPQGQNVDELIKKATDCQQSIGIANFLYNNKEYEKAMAEYLKVYVTNVDDSYAKIQYDLCKSETDKATQAAKPQTQPQTAATLNTAATSSNTRPAQTNTLTPYPKIQDHPNVNISGLYKKGEKLKNAGNTCMGCGLLLISLASLSGSSTEDPKKIEYLLYTVAAGGACALIGLPIWASGKSKIKKATLLYNEDKRNVSELKVGFSGNGLGLAFTF